MIQPIRAKPRQTSTNESGPACLTAGERPQQWPEVRGLAEDRPVDWDWGSLSAVEDQVSPPLLPHVLPHTGHHPPPPVILAHHHSPLDILEQTILFRPQTVSPTLLRSLEWKLTKTLQI